MLGNILNFKGLNIAKMIILLQFFIILFFSSICFVVECFDIFSNNKYCITLSVFLGGMIYLIPFIVFSVLSMRRKVLKGREHFIVLDFFIGTIIKLFLVITLFLIVFMFFPTVQSVVLASFIVLFVTQWIILVFFNSSY